MILGDEESSACDRAYEIAQSIRHELRRVVEIDCRIGIGGAVDRLSGLPQSCQPSGIEPADMYRQAAAGQIPEVFGGVQFRTGLTGQFPCVAFRSPIAGPIDNHCFHAASS